MNNDIVEKIARAICLKDYPGHPDKYDRLGESTRELYEDFAQAALKVILEEMEPMRGALNSCIDMYYPDGKSFDDDAVREALTLFNKLREQINESK